MTAAQIHLALNHFPIAGSILALVILIWGLVAKSDQIKMVGIGLIIIASVTGGIVAATGDGAEEIVEHKPLVTEHLIHEHEEAADAAAMAMYLASVFGIAWLVMKKLNKPHSEKVFIALLIVNLASAGMVANAAHKGGQIRHDEIRDGAVVGKAGGESSAQKESDKEKESEEKESEEKNEKTEK